MPVSSSRWIEAALTEPNERGRYLGPASSHHTVTVSDGKIPTAPGSRMRLEVGEVPIAAPCRVLSTGTISIGDTVHLTA